MKSIHANAIRFVSFPTKSDHSKLIADTHCSCYLRTTKRQPENPPILCESVSPTQGTNIKKISIAAHRRRRLYANKNTRQRTVIKIGFPGRNVVEIYLTPPTGK